MDGIVFKHIHFLSLHMQGYKNGQPISGPLIMSK